MEFDVTAGAHPGEDSAFERSGVSMSMSVFVHGLLNCVVGWRLPVAELLVPWPPLDYQFLFLVMAHRVKSRRGTRQYVVLCIAHTNGSRHYTDTGCQAARQHVQCTYSMRQEPIWIAAGGIADAGFIVAQHKSNKVCH